jgi:hypothetical protein
MEIEMKTNALKHVMALGLAAMMAVGASGVASARTNARDYLGVWHLDDRNGDGWGRDGRWNDRDGGRQDEWNDRQDSRYGSPGRDDYRGERYGSRGRLFGARLPETFRIERNRREFRLESMDGRLLREMDAGRNRQLTSQRNLPGARIFETYTLTNNGRRLMIRTTIRGSQGTREMTSVYERA